MKEKENFYAISKNIHKEFPSFINLYLPGLACSIEYDYSKQKKCNEKIDGEKSIQRNL